jgi:hypothetical protein
MNFNFKNRIITKNKRSSNPSNIYGWNPLIDPFSKIETPPLDSIRNFQNRSPKFGGGSNSSEQLLLIHASSVESEGTTAFVLSRASSRCLRFIDPTEGWSPIDNFVLGSSGVVFSGEPPPLLYLGFLRVVRFPVHAGSCSPVSLDHCYT